MIYNAPSVRYPVGLCLLALAIAGVLWFCGFAAAISLWQLTPDTAPAWRWALGFVASAAAGAWMVSSWCRSPTGELRWDGEQWFWYCAKTEINVMPQPELDIQSAILLSFDMPDKPRWLHGSQWLWIERSRNPSAWADMRRAVYSRARSATHRETGDNATAPSASTAHS